ncbi:hypothetical protein C8Q80DRAFT_564800 [Daedaleopsis nitida]|nr:hypothetical protein C8Q80DRAFT_564800 [Daedaleopsis nitida]
MPYTNDRPNPTHRSNSSRALKRNSSTPTFINLDDCKPILSTTTTNTSTNSSANGKTAFVFTSSRTLRALQDQEEQYHSVAPSPSSPPASPESESSYHARSRASLTLSQVVKHSEGAIDARSLIGPKMRAAGFVNLPNTLGSRFDLDRLSTPSSPSMPPTRALDWSIASQERAYRPPTHTGTRSSSLESAGSSEFTPGASRGFFQTSSLCSLPGPSSSNGSDSSGMLSIASSSTLTSSSPSSTALSSVSEADESARGERSTSRKGKAKAHDAELAEFPFPFACDSPRSQGSHGSRASSATASPTIMGTVPPASHPFSSPVAVSSSRQQAARTEKATRRQRSSSDEKRKAKNKSPAKLRVELTPSFATVKRPVYSRQYSLTELCDSSPFVWMTKSEMFAPPAPISRSPPRSFATSVISSPAASKPRPPVYPPHPQPKSKAHRHRRHRTTTEGLPCHPDPASRPHRIVSEPIRMPTVPLEHGSSDQESGSAQKANRSDKGRDRGNQVETTNPSRALLSPVEIRHNRSDNDLPGHGQNAVGVVIAGGRARGRDTRGKVLGASETAEDRATAHAHAEMDQEKAMALEGLAALELAHRERAQEYPQHLITEHERNRILKQKLRVHHKHKARGKALLDGYSSESETTMVDDHISVIRNVR